VGKTFAADWFLIACAQAGQTALDGATKVVTPLLLRDAAYDADERRRLQRVGVMVLDDLGCEGADPKGTILWCLTELLDWRWRNLKKTLITSNLTAARFAAKYGARIVDRLMHDGTCTGVEGPNLRLSKSGSDS
jgi:DNA replication protein DnaC